MNPVLNMQWQSIANTFFDIQPPLRPGVEDITIFASLVSELRHTTKHSTGNALLLGVTPEIATLDWPSNMTLTAIDTQAAMIDRVWPGDIAGKRKAQLGNWLNPVVNPGSIDMILGDGCLNLQSFPDGYHQFADSMRAKLRPGGALVTRVFVNPSVGESLKNLESELRSHNVNTVEALRLRTGMSLVTRNNPNVAYRKIWQTLMQLADRLDISNLPESRQTVLKSIAHYEKNDGSMSFPWVDQITDVLSNYFVNTKVIIPECDFGRCAPIIVAYKESKPAQ